MVDWSLARQIARFAAGSPTTAPRLDADLPALVEESAGHLRAYAGVERKPDFVAPPPADATPDWVAAGELLPGIDGEGRGREQLVLGGGEPRLARLAA